MDGQSAESSTNSPFDRITPPSPVSMNCFQSAGFVTIECWSGWVPCGWRLSVAS